MSRSKKIQIALLTLSGLILFYSYYYLPSQNKGSIKVDQTSSPATTVIPEEAKNTFTNTEYKNQDSKGQIFTTRAAESYIYQNKPDLIYLISPYSFTKLEKDQFLIEIRSKTGLFDKANKITSYNDDVSIKNKNYIVTANSAKHFGEKNLIVINGNVVMKDLTMGLSHIAYADTVEINTITNDAVAFMNSTNDKVKAKKFK